MARFRHQHQVAARRIYSVLDISFSIEGRASSCLRVFGFMAYAVVVVGAREKWAVDGVIP
jgi:hypothetical protein